MSNLLPTAAQKRIRRIYRARLVSALALALMGLAGVFLLALIPSYLALTAASPVEEGGTVTRNTEENQAVVRAQTIVSQVLPVLASTSSPSMVLDLALADAPAGVTVDHVSFAKRGAGGTLTLSGSAPREKVAAFRDALAAEPLFISATVPVSALVGTGAGQFSLTLEMAGSENK